MKITVKRNLALALDLTRSGKLVEATLEIQKALGANGSPTQDLRERQPLGDVVDTLYSHKKPVKLRIADNTPILTVPQNASNNAQFSTKLFTCDAGTREYKFYQPVRQSNHLFPLLLMLHGCTQNADDFAAGTGMNAIAESLGFMVAYPNQTRKANASGCWNWFQPGDQHRGAGEPAILAGIIEDIVANHNIDTTRIFVAGLSAGAAMAMIMGASYPEIFSGIGIHSGLPYRSANDVMSAFSSMRGNPSRIAEQPKQPTIIFHGDADSTVHPTNGKRIADGRQDVSHETIETGKVDVAGGRNYTRTIRYDQNGIASIEHWAIAGAGHAWAGGSNDGTYTDPKGPNASAQMARFFLT